LTIGCLDLMGRKSLPAFVAGLLGISHEPAIQRVTKTEDLLQLLQFKRADAVLLPEGFLADLQARTKMELKILRLPTAKVLRVGVAFPGNRQAVEGAIRALPATILEQLGVDHWR
jgi:ABC-type amino acid transport substrate-binding protein